MANISYTGCVYLVTNLVNGRQYIGKSIIGLHMRRLTHYSAVRKGQKQPFVCALRKYGRPCFEWRELYLSDDNASLLAAEIALIADYRAANADLYNLTEGGDGALSRVTTAETRKKLGYLKSQEHRDNLRSGWTPERRAAQAERMRNRIVSDETRKRSSDAKIGNQYGRFRGSKTHIMRP